ncbi:50S ribosomal protein L18 [Candidatus Woesearchaeota archaeon]|nr:MAG: 50S ribosomal protein L18 [Candidatus Woesearchaeota archaeon]
MVNARHILGYRRKREGRTNYKKRLALLKSAKPRLVVRTSNRYVQVQLVTYEPDGDKVIVGLSSKFLQQHGWKGNGKSLPAVYITSQLLAKKAVEKGFTEAIADLGLQRHRAQGRLAAAIKGAIDGGLSLPADPSVFPPADRLAGKHLADNGVMASTVAKKLGVELKGDAA